MKLRDLSIRKKLVLSNIMMVLIPVLIVLVLLVGTVGGLFLLAGLGTRPNLTDAEGGVTNYQLQFSFDDISGDLVDGDFARDSRETVKTCRSLEAVGLRILIQEGEETLYLTENASRQEIEGRVAAYTAGEPGCSVFVREPRLFVYTSPVQAANGRTVQISAVSDTLPFGGGGGELVNTVKNGIKIGAAVVGVSAVVCIVLTGVLLAGVLSKNILRPLGFLRRSARAIRAGNLDCPADGYATHDEFGEVCAEFDAMRLQLKASMELQQRYETGRKELVAGISHDLSTPLTSIKGYVSGLIEGIADTPEKREHYLRTVYDTACNMEKLVEGLFLFSKLDLGGVPFHFETVELGAYFGDFCEETAPRLERQQMDLSFVNEAAGPAPACIDRVQFGRAVQNLVDNSVKYKKPGRGRLTISLRPQADGWEIAFSDDGRGVGQQEMDKIFESFYRTDPARSNVAAGSGLGLSITRQIIEQHGGSIHAEGAAGRGLTVRVALPAAREEEPDEKDINH